MNCQETRSLFEDALDRRLKGGVKRKFDLHLTRCPCCRSLYAAEQAEHARWFRALNGEGRGRKLPLGFADRLAAAVSRQSAARRVFADWLRLPRWAGIAAVLALMFAAFATIAWRIENGELRMGNGDDSRIENGELRMENDGGVSQTNSQFSILNSQFPSSPPPAVSPGEAKISPGEAKMTVKKLVANVKRTTATLLAAASLGATAGEPYQFIISGYPATNEKSVLRSAAIALDAGTYRVSGSPDEMDSRYRTRLVSVGTSLRSTRFCGMMIRVK